MRAKPHQNHVTLRRSAKAHLITTIHLPNPLPGGTTPRLVECADPDNLAMSGVWIGKLERVSVLAAANQPAVVVRSYKILVVAVLYAVEIELGLSRNASGVARRNLYPRTHFSREDPNCHLAAAAHEPSVDYRGRLFGTRCTILRFPLKPGPFNSVLYICRFCSKRWLARRRPPGDSGRG